MKSFIITMFIFSGMILLIGINSVYIHRTVEEITVFLDEESFSEDKALSFKEYWDGKLSLLSLSVPHRDLEHISELCEELCHYVSYGDKKEIDRTRLLLIDAASDLQKLESFGKYLFF